MVVDEDQFSAARRRFSSAAGGERFLAMSALKVLDRIRLLGDLQSAGCRERARVPHLMAVHVDVRGAQHARCGRTRG
jgi:hypothetical protein